MVAATIPAENEGVQIFEGIRKHIQSFEEILKVHDDMSVLLMNSTERVWIRKMELVSPWHIRIDGDNSNGHRVSILAHIHSVMVEIIIESSPLISTKNKHSITFTHSC